MKKLKYWVGIIKRTFHKLKNKYFIAKSHYIKYIDTLPIRENVILLESQHGKSINGNIYYILRYLSENDEYKNFDIYLTAWGGKQNGYERFLVQHNIKNVKIVTQSTDMYFRVLASAKYLINDNTFLPFFQKSQEQVYLNTWHGTPFKTLGKQINSDFIGIGNTQKNFMCADYLLFPNQYTYQHIVHDYMLSNISSGEALFCGYPRNTIFFDDKRKKEICEKINPDNKHLYAYMPTFRGEAKNGATEKNDIYLLYFLFEIDKRMSDDEILYVNLHPISNSKVNFKNYKHIRPFPSEYETYEFLSCTEILITDYSSVFFDYALTGNKIILFVYDNDEYFEDRGTYLNLSDLPFPKVETIEELFIEINTGINYDNTKFVENFCPFDSIKATQKICDTVILGKPCDVKTQKLPNNGKKNVFIYAGNLANNGVTSAMKNLVRALDISKNNYYITYVLEKTRRNADVLLTLPSGVGYYGITGDANLTIKDRVIRKLFKEKIICAKGYMTLSQRRIEQSLERMFCGLKIDTLIQYNGYEDEIILTFSTFSGPKIIFVHNDMQKEIATRGNQRRDTLRYAYSKYDKVVVVTEDIKDSTMELSGGDANIVVINNIIDYENICRKALLPISIDSYTRVSTTEQHLYEVLNSGAKKFINIGRFSPEKGQERLIDAFAKVFEHNSDSYLIIVGGNQRDNLYQILKSKIERMGFKDRIILVLNISNPYSILNACDYFVLSSYYEGFGLVIAEADVLEKPVISTDIVGPRLFMREHGGKLVPNNEDGLVYGMQQLLDGKVNPMNVNYNYYNSNIVTKFEKLLEEISI